MPPALKPFCLIPIESYKNFPFPIINHPFDTIHQVNSTCHLDLFGLELVANHSTSRSILKGSLNLLEEGRAYMVIVI